MSVVELVQNNPKLVLKYRLGSVDYDIVSELALPLTSFPHFTVAKAYDTERELLTFAITPTDKDTEAVRLVHLEFNYDMDLSGKVMLAEGFQSWSQTREMDKQSTLAAINPLLAYVTQFDLQGDYGFYPYDGNPGVTHANCYTQLRSANSTVPHFFIGSTTERTTGYTYYRANFNTNTFSIYKDVQGRILHHDEAFRLEFLVPQTIDSVDALWKRYASFYGGMAPAEHLTGWTSWYNFYEHVTEKDVVESLKALTSHEYPIDVFQIDDGYETAIGDWLIVDSKKFPRGMKVLAKEIDKAGYIPGLWLAPFAAGKKSALAKDHPDWLLTETDDRLMLAGPNWGGFYALDIYNLEVRTYLQEVFDVVIDDWGYKLLKLDFLFATAMMPRRGKSRGEVMADATELIAELTRGRARLLGSGLPLFSAWGRFDYCRISSDASPWWDHSLLRIGQVRERVATANALVSTLHRWPMHHMFGNDPDVYFVRSKGNKLTKDERYTLLVINNIIGELTLMSDNVAHYTPEEHRLYAHTFPKVHATVQSVNMIQPDVYQVEYTAGEQRFVTFCNLSPLVKEVILDIKGVDSYFEHRNCLLDGDRVAWHATRNTLTLRPHESRTVMPLLSTSVVVGSTGHIIPGWDIEQVQQKKDGLYLRTRQPRKTSSTPARDLFIQTDATVIYVDDKQATHVEHYTSPQQVTMMRLTV